MEIEERSSQGSSSPPQAVFEADPADAENASQPFALLRASHGMRCLSQRMRPRNLHDILGQDHLLGPRGSLLEFLRAPNPSSFWLTGPPSSGKTSIAISASRFLDVAFLGLLFPGSDPPLLRQVLSEAQRSPNKPCMLFTNCLPQFPTQDQEIVLPYISNHNIILCGSSTIDPHGLVSPLVLSHCSSFTLRKLEPRHVKHILLRAIDDKANGLVQSLPFHTDVVVDDDAIDFLSSHVDGNARLALNVLEYVAFKIITNECFPNGNGGAIGTTLRELLQTLKDLHGAKEREYARPFKQFHNGLQMARRNSKQHKQQPFVHVTLSCVQDAFS